MTNAPIHAADFDAITHHHGQFCDRHNDAAITLQNDSYIIGRQRGVLDMMPKIEALKSALIAARARIQADRNALAQCHTNPVTHQLDEAGAAGVAEYDAILTQIDAALKC